MQRGLLVALLLSLGVAKGVEKRDFEHDIAPILARSCHVCHGAKVQMGGLRLDGKAAALKAIRPGDAEASELYRRVAGIGKQARMPMGGKALSAGEIALIQSWIAEGAVWPDGAGLAAADVKPHWAYVPPKRPALPALKTANPIDAFIQARLVKENLRPSAAAEKATLLRRLSLDLTGLPPSVADVDAFLADASAKAYSRQVERLLASPHYGEKWGRWWLDAARYADSDGYEKDKQRQVWFYRDWVLQSLNRDLPYDRFLIEQIAGDLLPNATQDQRVATGFLRNSMINEEGGIDPEQFRMEAMFDRMEALGKAVLGVTIQCAQCHTHKYDPIQHDDYYRLFAFINNTYESSVSVYTPVEQAKRAQILSQTAAIENDLRKRSPDWAEQMARWADSVRDEKTRWTVVRPDVDDISTGGQRYLPQEDGSLLAAGYAPTKHTVKLALKQSPARITAFRLELLNHADLPMGGPGRSIDGTGALTEFEVQVASAAAPDKAVKIKLASATADLRLPEKELAAIFFDKSKNRRVTGPIEYAIDGKDETAWGIDAGPGVQNVPRQAVFVPEKPIDVPAGATVSVLVKQNHGGWNSDDNQNNNLGRIRISVTADEAAAAEQIPAAVRAILRKPRGERTLDDQQRLFSYWRTTVPAWAADNARVDEIWKQHPAGTSQLVMAERESRRPTHVLERGDFLQLKNAVTPGVPAFLNPLPAGVTRPTRLDFARWLVDRQAPTTARAVVNRVWQAYFGTGLTATSEDLGRQGEPPSHPELLDWLAVEFMERGWSVKQLHRQIVTSDTYRQSSTVTPELLERDPANRLLARGPRFRVEAEGVRDIALAASGLLNTQVGGPSVYPPAPDFLFQPPASYGPKNWHEDKDGQRYRRALYTFRYRSVPYPMLQTFDAPNGDTSCVRRSRSNTPLQALTTLNEPLFLDAARALGERALRDGGNNDAARIGYAFRRCVARAPTAAELAELMSLLSQQQSRLDRPRAWTMLARVLLNLDETITKE